MTDILNNKIKQIANEFGNYEKSWLNLLSSKECQSDKINSIIKDLEKIKNKINQDKYYLSTEMLKVVFNNFSNQNIENNDFIEFNLDNCSIKFMKNKKTNYFWKIIYHNNKTTKLITTLDLLKYDFVQKMIQTNRFDEKFPIKNNCAKEKKNKI